MNPEALPWTRFLPQEDRRLFHGETRLFAEEHRGPAPQAHVIAEWRHTAEVYADPELLATLARAARTTARCDRRRPPTNALW